MGGVQHSTLFVAEYLDLNTHHDVEIVLPSPGLFSESLSLNNILVKFYYPIAYKSTAFSFFNDKIRLINPIAWVWNSIAIFINLFIIKSNIHPNTNVVISKGLLNHITTGIACKLIKTPVICHLQDLITTRYFGLVSRLFNLYFKWIPNYIICDGDLIQKSLGENLKIKSKVILNGIKSKTFIREEILGAYIRNEFKMPENAYLIGHIARITPWKGQDYLIKAFHQFSKTNNNAYLLLIGSPLFDNDQYYNSIIKLIDELFLSEKVIMPGYRNDLQSLFSAMDLFLYPSIEKDTSPLALLSAISSGLPVGVSNINSLTEIVEVCPGVDVFNPNNPDEIISLMRKYKRKEAQELSGKLNRESGRKLFDISIHGQKMEKIIKQVYKENKIDSI
jgi:glycosyltransferase involved in cell wall biosynthesis